MHKGARRQERHSLAGIWFRRKFNCQETHRLKTSYDVGKPDQKLACVSGGDRYKGSEEKDLQPRGLSEEGREAGHCVSVPVYD